MDIKVRILAIRLLESIQKAPEYARSLGIDAGTKSRTQIKAVSIPDEVPTIL